MKYFLMILFILIICCVSESQNSFIKSIEYDDLNPGNLDFALDSSSILILDLERGARDLRLPIDINLIRLSRNGDLVSTQSFAVDSFSFLNGPLTTFNYFIKAKKGYYFVTLKSSHFTGFLCSEISGNNAWARWTAKDAWSLHYTGAGIISENKRIITFNSPYKDNADKPFFTFTGLAEWDLKTGASGWSYTYHLNNIDNPIGFHAIDFIELLNGDFIVSAVVINQEDQEEEYCIIKITPDGEVLKSIKFNSFNRHIPQDQSLTIGNDGYLYYSGQLTKRFSPNKDTINGFIAKFSPDLDLIWAKEMHADNIKMRGLAIKANSLDEISFAYFTTKDFPAILGKMNPKGELIWYKGYSVYNPFIQADDDGSFFMAAPNKYEPSGQVVPALIVAKTDPDGEIENCPQFDACLTLSDLDLPYEEVIWKRKPAPVLNYMAFTTETFPATIEDYCESPPIPNSFFHLPDTVCQFECVQPDSLLNKLAHAVEWTIIDPNGNQSTSQDTSFRLCLDVPGTYQIEHEVWVLGCSEFFSKTIEVLDPNMNLSLGSDSVFCDRTPFRLSPNADRPLTGLTWQNGQTTDYQEITTSGNYSVTATDGFCTQSTSVRITFIDDVIATNPIELPNDTAVCIDLLPFELVPQSDYINEFFMENLSGDKFQLDKSGIYEISGWVSGCKFSQPFEFTVTDCEVPVFIPSSFSPNNDGINDTLMPFGLEHKGEKLQIYDRWGGLIFQTDSEPFEWDGQNAPQGVYVLKFDYLNLRNQSQVSISADVTLVR